MSRIITLLSLVSFLFIQYTNAQIPRVSENLDIPIATMEFEQEEFNFGTIVEGEKVKNVFVFTNTSEVPLTIAYAKGSCGCTVPEWPREPILPGEASHLLVVFDSKGKRGAQAKRVTITANTEAVTTYLTLKGNVVKEKQVELPKNRSINEGVFNLYPNPTSELVNFSLNDYEGENATIEIFDRSGKLMTSKYIAEIELTSYAIELDNYTSGIYTATIVVGDKMRLAKQFVVR